MATTAAPQGHS